MGPARPWPGVETCVQDAALDQFSWHAVLCDFSEPDGDRRDPDDAIVPKIVAACVYPRVEPWVEAWDVASAAQTKRLAAVIEECAMYADESVPDSLSALERLLEAVQRRVKAYVDELIPEKAIRGAGTQHAPDLRAWLERRGTRVLASLAALRGAVGDEAAKALAGAVTARLPGLELPEGLR